MSNWYNIIYNVWFTKRDWHNPGLSNCLLSKLIFSSGDWLRVIRSAFENRLRQDWFNIKYAFLNWLIPITWYSNIFYAIITAIIYILYNHSNRTNHNQYLCKRSKLPTWQFHWSWPLRVFGYRLSMAAHHSWENKSALMTPSVKRAYGKIPSVFSWILCLCCEALGLFLSWAFCSLAGPTLVTKCYSLFLGWWYN